ncbi:PhyR-type response regulator RsiB1 [Sinorhizobium americanum]|uniref:DNA-directed RNA polymerase specialized sigma24 family protein n=1 Tax=Sinorhizobium americanum TaxID=194963 RepID=A0A1L3LPN7_9HYPH|nr:PhyR-type response regulator RsiB1 [Sinorhizobium americanum]APG85420.1 phyllosphere-induced regulator PhyR [Sinorhizobium americanum CCGM7]APG92078.1 phyllosphere-induced regulator PhyR [Sinorhizobium americanum]OAP34770.1 two-component response regulator [Sinorhizobium americanum]TCN32530.1 DNA-directed RNA polymerase specialized sigma24 family protein [Sinorhizobium americanum]
MTLSTRIAPFLPYLRRYSRALTGSQTSGDAYVAAVLEALIADTSIFPEASSDRVALFRLFTSLFGSSSVLVPEPVSPFAWEQRASVNLAAVSPVARQAFLLVSVEGFTPQEAAEVLDVDTAKLTSLLDRASQEISRQVATDIMIIEDEPLIAIDIEQMVESLGHRVTGIARTKDEAIALYKTAEPGMVLADIQLADGSSGIDAVNEILKTSTVPVIFITAFPERLLTGERPEPTFLVTKPFNPEMVKALISQALFFNESTKAAA